MKSTNQTTSRITATCRKHIRRHIVTFCNRLKVKFSYTQYWALGPELIPIYRQLAHRWLSHRLAAGCHYFLPGLQTPSQPKNVTVLRPVPRYTAWWQRHIHVNNLTKFVTQFCSSGTWTHDLLIACPTVYLVHCTTSNRQTAECIDNQHTMAADTIGNDTLRPCAISNLIYLRVFTETLPRDCSFPHENFSLSLVRPPRWSDDLTEWCGWTETSWVKSTAHLQCRALTQGPALRHFGATV